MVELSVIWVFRREEKANPETEVGINAVAIAI
jgi:hypothetical protein